MRFPCHHFNNIINPLPRVQLRRLVLTRHVSRNMCNISIINRRTFRLPRQGINMNINRPLMRLSRLIPLRLIQQHSRQGTLPLTVLPLRRRNNPASLVNRIFHQNSLSLISTLIFRNFQGIIRLHGMFSGHHTSLLFRLLHILVYSRCTPPNHRISLQQCKRYVDPTSTIASITNKYPNLSRLRIGGVGSLAYTYVILVGFSPHYVSSYRTNTSHHQGTRV